MLLSVRTFTVLPKTCLSTRLKLRLFCTVRAPRGTLGPVGSKPFKEKYQKIDHTHAEYKELVFRRLLQDHPMPKAFELFYDLSGTNPQSVQILPLCNNELSWFFYMPIPIPDRADKALALALEMKHQGIEFDCTTYFWLINLLFHDHRLSEATTFFEQIQQTDRMKIDRQLFSLMLQIYNVEQPQKTVALFSRFSRLLLKPGPNHYFVYSQLLHAHKQLGHGEKMLSLLAEMARKNIGSPEQLDDWRNQVPLLLSRAPKIPEE